MCPKCIKYKEFVFYALQNHVDIVQKKKRKRNLKCLINDRSVNLKGRPITNTKLLLQFHNYKIN